MIAPDAESEKHLNWLVTTGHVVAFTNGVFSPVEKFPKYGPQWQKKLTAKPAVEAKVADEAPVETVEKVVEEKKDETAPVVAE